MSARNVRFLAEAAKWFAVDAESNAMSNLIPSDARERMLEYGRQSARGEDIDPFPIVKLFAPDGAATWLLTELDPGNPDIAFGLCDLGLGFPELGCVSLSEIASVRGRLGRAIERDMYFCANRSLSAYAQDARINGRIQA